MFRRWFAFGLYGLELRRASWSKVTWMFRDVTVMSADAQDFMDTKDDRRTVRAMETAFGLAVWSDGNDAASMQFSHLIKQPQPTAFLVVKKKVRGDDDAEAAASAAVRAREVAAMLCLTRTFCTSDTAGVLDAWSLCDAPRISLFARPWIDPENGRWGAGQEIHKPGWLREPDVASGPQMVEAIREGAPLQTIDGAPWILADAIPLVRILSHHHRKPAEATLAQAALQAYRAHHAGDDGARMVQAMLSMEALFGRPVASDTLEARIAELVQLGPSSRAVTAQIFANYRDYVFAGQPVSSTEADLAVHLASAAMHAFAEALDIFHETQAVAARLDLLAEITANASFDDGTREDAWSQLGPVAPATRTLFERLQELAASSVQQGPLP